MVGEDELSKDRSDEVGDGDENVGMVGIAAADGTMVGVPAASTERKVGSGSENGIGGTVATPAWDVVVAAETDRY